MRPFLCVEWIIKEHPKKKKKANVLDPKGKKVRESKSLKVKSSQNNKMHIYTYFGKLQRLPTEE